MSTFILLFLVIAIVNPYSHLLLVFFYGFFGATVVATSFVNAPNFTCHNIE